MLGVFKKEFKITKEQIEEYIGRPAGSFGNEEIFLLQGVYRAVKEGQATLESYFPKVIEVPNPIAAPDNKKKSDDTTVEIPESVQNEAQEVFK
jgi:hypothetical protein